MHATSTTFAALGESGQRLGTHIVETNGQALVERPKTMAGDKHVALEEGTQSAWLYEILSPHAKEQVEHTWRRQLQRRSQRVRWTVEKVQQFEARYPNPFTRIVHPWPERRFRGP